MQIITALHGLFPVFHLPLFRGLSTVPLAPETWMVPRVQYWTPRDPHPFSDKGLLPNPVPSQAPLWGRTLPRNRLGFKFCFVEALSCVPGNQLPVSESPFPHL
jgi:hypothetical protein